MSDGPTRKRAYAVLIAGVVAAVFVALAPDCACDRAPEVGRGAATTP